jgi:hypothetical protein
LPQKMAGSSKLSVIIQSLSHDRLRLTITITITITKNNNKYVLYIGTGGAFGPACHNAKNYQGARGQTKISGEEFQRERGTNKEARTRKIGKIKTRKNTFGED